MSIEQPVDNLIAAGWYVLDSDFDPAALQHWRQQAMHCVDAMLGSDHVTTKHFENLVESARTRLTTQLKERLKSLAMESSGQFSAKSGSFESNAMNIVVRQYPGGAKTAQSVRIKPDNN